MKLGTRSILFIMVLLLASCNSTKFVPEGEYLLDKVKITSDDKEVIPDEYNEYRRQTPNAAVFPVLFGGMRMQLGIYNLAPKDTTTGYKRFWNKIFHKMGDAPVLYNSALTSLTTQQIQRVLVNKGYINAKVTNDVKIKNKKVAVTYSITANQPYRLRDYGVNLKNPRLYEIATDTAKSLIRPNMLFNADVLGAERIRIANLFRREGYYNFNKDYLGYSADSALNAKRVNLTLELRDFLKNSSDSINNIVFRKYTIRNVIYYINKEAILSDDLQNKDRLDTVRFRDFILVSPKEKILKLDALVQNTYINPKAYYSDDAVDKTYQSLNTLGPIKYVNISFKDTGKEQLDCYIIITPSKTISVSTELEGTYTAGFWGGATNINYVNKNAFNGAETFSLQGKAALELQKDVLAREFGAQAGIKFPRFMFPVGSYDFKRNIHANTEFSGAVNYIFRPTEFTTTNVSAGMSYSWNKKQYHHNFELFEINYVQFKVDPGFDAAYLSTGLYNRYNYSDHFIMSMGYSGSYSTFNAARPMQNYSTVRYSIESAGNLLYAVSHLLGMEKTDDSYQLFKVGFSQYVKGEYNITRHQIFDKNNRFVYHFGAGVGIPFANSNVIPFEKRFYSGGANSVRGWGESMLGPGAYSRFTGNKTRDFNQVGDIKLDMNMEYRTKLFWKAEGAAFIDAGNIWTIDNYKSQPLGQFKFDSFYNQLALAYGLGLRFDFSFFILRFDVGTKLFDPSEKLRSEQWKTRFDKDNYAFHFAIGYPF